jgi:hypothetical protein
MIREGDKVRVYPRGGSPEEAVVASVLLAARNQRSIAVVFGDKPWFLPSGFVVHRPLGVVMLASRAEFRGEPLGSWLDTISGGHYEMEEIKS